MTIDKTNVVFIGAGPIGLETAIQTKILNPYLNITLLEKYAQYQRKHILKLDRSTFKYAPKDERLTSLINKLIGSSKAHSASVPTQEVENRFKKLATKLGIKIIYQKVDNPTSLIKQFPRADIFIGADGAHSVVREKIFHDDLKGTYDVNHICEIKYEVKGQAHHLNFIQNNYLRSKIANLSTQHIGKFNGLKTPVTLRFFIDKNTYNWMYDNGYGATYKNKWGLRHQNIPDYLNKKIFTILKKRHSNLQEKRVIGSEIISVLKLTAYRSKKFVKTDYRSLTKWALVGDAAFGVPFFRSMNNSLKCGSKLALAITKYQSGDPSSHQNHKDPFDSYTEYVNKLATSEIQKVKTKGNGIELLNFGYNLASVGVKIMDKSRHILHGVGSVFRKTKK